MVKGVAEGVAKPESELQEINAPPIAKNLGCTPRKYSRTRRFRRNYAPTENDHTSRWPIRTRRWIAAAAPQK